MKKLRLGEVEVPVHGGSLCQCIYSHCLTTKQKELAVGRTWDKINSSFDHQEGEHTLSSFCRGPLSLLLCEVEGPWQVASKALQL